MPELSLLYKKLFVAPAEHAKKQKKVSAMGKLLDDSAWDTFFLNLAEEKQNEIRDLASAHIADCQGEPTLSLSSWAFVQDISRLRPLIPSLLAPQSIRLRNRMFGREKNTTPSCVQRTCSSGSQVSKTHSSESHTFQLSYEGAGSLTLNGNPSSGQLKTQRTMADNERSSSSDPHAHAQLHKDAAPSMSNRSPSMHSTNQQRLKSARRTKSALSVHMHSSRYSPHNTPHVRPASTQNSTRTGLMAASCSSRQKCEELTRRISKPISHGAQGGGGGVRRFADKSSVPGKAGFGMWHELNGGGGMVICQENPSRPGSAMLSECEQPQKVSNLIRHC